MNVSIQITEEEVDDLAKRSFTLVTIGSILIGIGASSWLIGMGALWVAMGAAFPTMWLLRHLQGK